ncbi:hypothetical protein LCGC14_1084340 [marine sediment metagenome]|uniref:Uncharacterized protein n=1 Tax=marine sediment metagenome TaxID=412755 RepID=A0A0F9PXG1_9ZZZZ
MNTPTHFTKSGRPTVAAHPPALFGVGRILSVVGMSLGTVCPHQCKGWAHPSDDILRLRNGLKMAGAHTAPLAAEMVGYLLGTERSPRQEERETVSPHLPTVAGEGTIAIAELPGSPEPARSKARTVGGDWAVLIDLLPETLLRSKKSLVVAVGHVGVL